MMCKRIIAAVLCIILTLAFCSCDMLDNILNAEQEPRVDMEQVKTEINTCKISDFAQTDKETNYVLITVRDHGQIVVRLCPGEAPITVSNFKKLVGQGFYDGLIFHRIIRNFMIQGGGFDQNGTQKKTETAIKGEFASNGVENNLLHVRGVISMARTNVKDSATSQFFICDATSAHLDGEYAAFGYVLAGMETVDSIAAVETGYANAPLSPVVIESIVFAEPIE